MHDSIPKWSMGLSKTRNEIFWGLSKTQKRLFLVLQKKLWNNLEIKITSRICEMCDGALVNQDSSTH